MDPLYQKISSLPEDTKTLLSSAQFLGQIEILENTYHLKLVSIGFGYIVGVITLAEVRAKLQQQNITDPNQDKIITILDTLAQQFSNLSSLPKKGKNSSKEASGVTFSSEDDEEINQIKQQAPTIATAAPNYEAQADAIIASFGYNETDDVMRKRLQTVIVARLRGVRDDLEAIDVLTKSKKVGGLEFTGDQATSLLRLMAGKSANGGWQIADGGLQMANSNKKNDKPSAISHTPSANRQRPTPPPNLPTLVDLPTQTNLPVPVTLAGLPVIDEEDGLPIIRMPELANSVEQIANSKQTIPVGRGGSGTARIKEQPVTKVPSPSAISHPPSAISQLPPAEPQSYPTPIVPSTANAVAAAKPQLDGVKIVSRLVGPIEELEQMTLIDFRRLGSTPEAMVKGVADKIELLSRESFAKRHEAIAAWQRSEVTKFYRLLGQESLVEGKPIEAVIAERRQAGKPTLTLEEFNELVGLHTKLRY